MNRYSFKVLLLTGAALSACAFSFSLGLGERKAVDLARNPSANGTVLIEWKIVAPAMTGFLQYVVWSSVSAFFPLYAVQCGVGNPGIFFSAMALMMLIGRTFGGRIFETWGKQKIIVTFMTLSIAALVMLSFSRTLPLFIFIGLLWGMAAAFVFPTCMAYALDYAGTSGGTALGTYQAFTDLGVALGPVVTGTILSLTGYGQVFLFLACICVFNLCYSRHYVWKKHDERQKVRNVL